MIRLASREANSAFFRHTVEADFWVKDSRSLCEFKTLRMVIRNAFVKSVKHFETGIQTFCKKSEIKKESLYDLYISSITQVNTKNGPASRRYLYTE